MVMAIVNSQCTLQLNFVNIICHLSHHNKGINNLIGIKIAADFLKVKTQTK